MRTNELSAEYPVRFNSKPKSGWDQRYPLRLADRGSQGPASWLARHLLNLERYADEGTCRYRDLVGDALEYFTILTDQLDVGMLHTKIEDACFRILQSPLYHALAQYDALNRFPDQMCLVVLKAYMENLLKQHGISTTITGRTKGLYSLYCKMNRLGCSLEEVVDRVGLRIIVPSAEQCYTVLNILHNRFCVVSGTDDDYIKFPKRNGYQALHTCIYPVPGIPHRSVEFQIRTWAMHQEAEFGSCAHWRYKRESNALLTGAVSLRRLRSLLPRHENDDTDARFMVSLRRLAAAGAGYRYA